MLDFSFSSSRIKETDIQPLEAITPSQATTTCECHTMTQPGEVETYLRQSSGNKTILHQRVNSNGTVLSINNQ